jgi:ribosomal protein S18 acetylase RimI-like enzyme
VVVDVSQRGKGVGRELMRFAIDFARLSGAKSIDLTSRPFRIAANQLYLKMGFEKRETNVYRYTIH